MVTSLVRQLRLQPLYALACAATLAMAVGAAGASLAVVKRAMLDPLPYPDGERLMSLHTSADNRTTSLSIFVFEDLKKSAGGVLTSFAAMRFSTLTYQATDLTRTVAAQEVTPEYFDTFGVRPALGGAFPAGEPNAAVVSWNFWQQLLSADPNVIGRSIVLDGVSRQIVGVMPASFAPPYDPNADLLLPLDMGPLLRDTARARRTISGFARLAPGVTEAQMDAYLETFSQSQRDQYPAIHARERWIAQPLRTSLMGTSRAAVMGTAAAAGLLLVIVCANIAGLSVVNAAATRRHDAIRTALGASAGRIFRDRLRDSLAIALVGSVAGLWLAYGLIAVAARYQGQFLSMMRPVQFDAWIAGAGLLLGVATGVIAALAPIGMIRRLQDSVPFWNARGATGDRTLGAVRSSLVMLQVAVAIVLIVGAGLLVRTVANLSATEIGYDTTHFSFFSVTLPQPKYRGTPAHVQFERDVLERIGAIGGVSDVSASVGFPVMGSMGARLTILDRPDQTAPPEIGYYSVTPNFFSFLGVPIVEGRDIAETDDFPAPRVVVINETMARQFWPEGNAIGAKVKIGAGAATDREIIVIGIAADVRQNGPTQDVRPAAYGSTLQYSWPRRFIAVKSDRPAAALAKELHAAVYTVDPAVAPSEVQAIDSVVEQQTARHRLVMMTLTLFGAVATVLCAFGLYATVALSSQGRRREYAIRVALGSSRSRVCWMVVRQSLILAGAGAVAGVLLASAGTQAIASLLHGVTAGDQATFATAVATMLALAVLSASLPALKAARIDPVETLKSE
jgi:putative ABC transport system permease protein